MLDIQSLETWLWDAACAIRGPVDAPKFKDYILPLVFLKRLSDVFDDEIERLSAEYGNRDLIEAVILLPENLFYNAAAPGIILVVNRRKPRCGEILLINASQQFAKGRPKNYLTEEHIARIAALYHEWRAEAGMSTIITSDEAARNDYNLSPSRYVSTNGKEVGANGHSPLLPLEEAVVRLQEAEEERAEADRGLSQVLQKLGLWR